MGTIALLACFRLAASDLYVSPSGNDNNPGTKGKPLATLVGARDNIRSLKDAGALTNSVTVHLRAGAYPLAQAVEFTQEDSGTESSPITYLAEQGATVRVTGGREVSGWRPVTNRTVLERLDPEARGHVMVSDLKMQGLADPGTLEPRGFDLASPIGPSELFCDDKPMKLARWPNAGFRSAISKDGNRFVIVDTDRMRRWKAEPNPWVFAYWRFDWSELYEPLAGVDAERHALLRTEKVKPAYGITPKNARWYAFNLLAELDTPGEYYLDHTKGLLYFWPPHHGGRTVVSLTDNLIQAENLSHVTFQGITFEMCRGTAITIDKGRNCRVIGCTIRDTGRKGVVVSGGERDEVFGCDVYYTGAGGIFMSGGDRPTLTPAHHNAENNHVHHYARWARTYHPGIGAKGVGIRIAHNLIHDGPHMALSASGNDNLVELNEIYNVVEESGDAGAYYVGRDWTQRGTVLRYNYWHDILGPTGFRGMTIYFDDQHCGNTVYGNLFVRCMHPVFIGGGDDNVVTNNVFLDCWDSAHLDNRGMNWQKKFTADEKNPNGLRARLRAMPYTNAPWRARYPNLANILNDDPGVPKRNVFEGNISAGGKWNNITPAILKHQTVTNNLVFNNDKDWVRLITDKSGQPLRLKFKDPAAVKKMGFAPLPLKQMGLHKDKRRASWPVKRNVRVVHPDKAVRQSP